MTPYKIRCVDELPNLISYLIMSCDTSYPLCTARGCKIDILESVLCQLFHFAQWNFVQNEIKFAPDAAFCTISSTSLYWSPHCVYVLQDKYFLVTKTESEVWFQKLFKTRHFGCGSHCSALTRNDDFILRINANIFLSIWPSHSVVFLPCFLLINRKILIFSSKVQMLLMTRLVVAFIHVAALLIWVSND